MTGRDAPAADPTPAAATPARPSDPRPERDPLVPPEAQVFVQMAAFGLIVGAVYWFLTYETAGSVMLVAFGLASAVACVAIFLGARRAHRHAVGPPRDAEPGPVPRPDWMPLLIGVGLGGLALGAAFGPWLAIAGALVALVGGRAWLEAAIAEADEGWRPGPRGRSHD